MTAKFAKPADSPEMKIYREQVAAAVEAAAVPLPAPPAVAPPREVLFNRTAEHAAVLVEHIFHAARDEVNIVSSRLDVTVYGTGNVIDAAAEFLRRNPAAQINVLVESDVNPRLHPWLTRLIGVDSNRVKLWRVPEKVSARYPFNFAVSDRKHYRLEQDRNKFEAFAQFGNEKFGVELGVIFADIKKGCTPISLH